LRDCTNMHNFIMYAMLAVQAHAYMSRKKNQSVGQRGKIIILDPFYQQKVRKRISNLLPANLVQLLQENLVKLNRET
jgi:hypothetical protein